MKITLKQLRQTVQEAISFDVDYLDSIGSQEMADAKRAVGEDPAAQAAHLGIGVEDWYTIRQELDDHYEDRHMEDQMAFDDDPDLDDDGMLSVGELVKMTQNIADDIKENKMKITRRQLRQIIKEEVIQETVSIPVNQQDRIYMMLGMIDDVIERTRGVLSSESHENITYTEKAVGTGPERVDRALQKELANLKRLVGALERKLTEKGMEAG